MRIRVRNELIPLNLLVVVLIVAITFSPSNILCILLGIPFILFFPGYTLTAALFPKREGMDGVERVAISFGLSIAVVPLIGLILNYTQWGIRLEPILYSVASFILISSIMAWLRRRRLRPEERFNIEFQMRMPGWGSTRDKVLSIILMITILGALGTLGYTIARPKVGERFSEFYIIGLEGKAEDYPKELVLGEKGTVIVGIVNHEHEIVRYQVVVMIDGVRNKEIEPIVLANEERREEIVSFIPDKAGEGQKVEFLLYKNGEAEPCLEPLRLWVNVTR